MPASRPALITCATWRPTSAGDQVDGPRWKDLEEFLFARAMEHDSPKLLFRLACEYLASSRLVRPGVVLVLERVATARKRARKETWQRVEPALTGFLRAELDGMLVPDPLLGRPPDLAGDRASLIDAGGGEGRAGEGPLLSPSRGLGADGAAAPRRRC